MAKYEVAYMCGHSETLQLYGPIKERTSYIEYARESRLCPKCYAEDCEQRHAAENEANAEANARACLPTLHGKRRQVAWAETIRRRALDASGNQVVILTGQPDAAEKFGITPAEVEMHVAAANAAAEDARRELERQASATWWIDHRERVDSFVHVAQRGVLREATADHRARLASEREAREERNRQEALIRRRAEAQAKEDEWMREVIRAQTFVVAGSADSVLATPYRAGGDLVIQSRDGRTAHGYIDYDGDWVVYQIGAYTNLPSTHPEMERIAREAKAQHDLRWDREVTGGSPSQK